MAKKALKKIANSNVKSTHDAVETAIGLSKQATRGTWEGSARKLRMGFKTWEFGESKVTNRH